MSGQIMTREQFKSLMDPLVIALRADFDLPTWTVYFRALEDVPAPLLAAAVQRAMQSATFMPKPGELRTLAEQARAAIMAAHPYDGCASCEDQRGYQTLLGSDGQKTVTRCGCFARHQQALAALGVGPQTRALPAAREDAWTPIGESVE